MAVFEVMLEIFLCCCLLLLVGSTSPTPVFPGDYTEVRNARVYDRFYDFEKLNVWLAWSDLDGNDHLFRYPSVTYKDKSPSYEDTKTTFNSTAFPCGWSGVRFQHRGGKEVFPVHPDCSMCLAYFNYMKSTGCCLSHGTKVEMRCYKVTGADPPYTSDTAKLCKTSEGTKEGHAWVSSFVIGLLLCVVYKNIFI